MVDVGHDKADKIFEAMLEEIFGFLTRLTKQYRGSEYLFKVKKTGKKGLGYRFETNIFGELELSVNVSMFIGAGPMGCSFHIGYSKTKGNFSDHLRINFKD